MKGKVKEIFENRFNIREYEGTDKVCDLTEAIRKNIKPGMLLHTCQTGVMWCSAILYEIARQFWGKYPGFTITGISMNHPISVLVHGGLVKKLITSYCGDPYYTPGPNAAFQRAYKEKTMQIEVAEFAIKKMKTRWGSCNIKVKRIWLNLELAKKPKECIEYIVVHEMTHLLERHHNERFTAYVDKFLPKWRFYKEELNRSPLRHENWSY